MVLQRLFRPGAHKLAGQALYEAATRQARQPILYADLGAPDTTEGRFELYTLHVVLLLHRLRGHDVVADRAAQALFDAYLLALDETLREMGVGDLSVGKKMRKLGEAFYGRAKAYETALSTPDMDGLDALIERTIYNGTDAAHAGDLAAYVRRSVTALAVTSLEDVMAAKITWAPILS